MATVVTTEFSARMIHDLSQPQRDRLAFIDLRLRLLGELRRQHLIDRFEIQAAAATRDIALYKELAGDNIDYDTSSKTYVASEAFKALFDTPTALAISWLMTGLGEGEPRQQAPGIPIDFPDQLSWPKIDILSVVTQAINKPCPVLISYESLNGSSTRVILPFALIDNGLRWHVRGNDRKTGQFRDFVLTRISKAELLPDAPVLDHERGDQDIEWVHIVEIILVPHPDQPRPEVTVLDYGMVNGYLKVNLRAATVGYTLRKWSVDCSPDHSLRGHEHRLWMKNWRVLYGVRNAVLAPGFKEPED